jgi:PAS domain S-box-containing protein
LYLNKKRFLYALPIVLLLVVVIAGWFATDYLGNKARQEIIKDSRGDASSLSIHISDTLNNVEGAVKSLSESPWIAPTLLSKGVQNIERANKTLDRYNSAMNASVSYLMDTNGMTVASSNRNDPDSALGVSYRFRPYFQEAVKGKPHHDFALGITSKKRSFYASYPVQNHRGEVIGVVTMKKDLDDMETFFSHTAFCLLISPDGIIFLSSKPEMVLKSLWPLDKTKQKKLIASRQFGNKLPEAVVQKEMADGAEVILEGKNYFVSRKVIGRYGWSTVILTPTDRIWIYKLTGILVTIFISFLIIVFSGVLYLTDRSREAIRQSEIFLSNTFDNSPFAQWISDERGTLIKQNQACRELFHVTDKEVVGKYNIFNDKIVEMQGFMPCVRTVFERGEKANFTIIYSTAELRHLNPQQKVSLVLELTISPVKNGEGKVKNAIIQHVDISERKRAEEMLKESEKKYRLLADNIQDVVFLMDMNLNYIYISPSVKLLTGYEPEKALQRTPAEILTPSSEDLAIRTLTEILEMETSEQRELNVSRTLQLEIKRKDGTTVWTEVKASIVRDENQRPIGIMGVTRDITERKQVEQALREGAAFYRTLFENTGTSMILIEEDMTIRMANEEFVRNAGYSEDEINGRMKWIEIVHPDDLARMIEQHRLRRERQGSALPSYEFRYITKAGDIKDALLTIKLVPGTKKSIASLIDITERKRIEEALKESETKLYNIIHGLAIPAFVIGNDHKVIYWNEAMEKISNIVAANVVGTNQHWRAFYSQERPCMADLLLDEVIDKIPQWYERKAMKSNLINGAYEATDFFPLLGKGGEWLHFTASTIRDSHGNLEGAVETLENITERKKAEEALKNSEAKYRDIFENAIEGIYQATTEGRFITANAALARMAGYSSPEELIESVKDIENQLYVYPDDRKKFLEIMAAKGFVSGFEVEFYKKDGSRFWVVINARTVKDEQGKIIYLEGLIENIAIRKHAEEQLHKTLENLRKSFGATINVMVSATELRDPYTAGHQTRTTKLACAIAAEMGLPDDKIEGLRMAGSIHDIGKLSIPSEILVKPTKLTNTEFSIIQDHSQIGHDMLKDVASPWPLAQIVYQHHERMNGTGYPKNLKGDEILLEARILAVADVVEAMGSHRPYRPTLGTEAALEEITKNKGILYDSDVADACLKLFREKGYQLS